MVGPYLISLVYVPVCCQYPCTTSPGSKQPKPFDRWEGEDSGIIYKQADHYIKTVDVDNTTDLRIGDGRYVWICVKVVCNPLYEYPNTVPEAS